MERHDDPVNKQLKFQSSKNGAVFRSVQFEAENPEKLTKLEGKPAFVETGAGNDVVENAQHPLMCCTD